MKIAILIRGFSILNNKLFKNFQGNEFHYKNHILSSINELKKQNHQLSIFFHTYVVNNNITTLINDLNPEDFIVNYIDHPLQHNYDYIQANIFSLFSVLSLAMKYCLVKKHEFDKIIIVGFDYTIEINDNVIKKIDSFFAKTQFNLDINILFNHKNELHKKGFIFGIHETQITKMKELFSKSHVIIDGMDGDKAKSILYTLIHLFIPINNQTIQNITTGTYKLLNVKSNKLLAVDDPSPKKIDNVSVNTQGSVFYITSLSKNNSNKYLIRLGKPMKNQNGSDGWHLYTLPNDNKLYGAGNDGLWANFIIDKIDNKYLIRSFHEKKNKKGNIGKYLYIDDDLTIKTDGDISMDNCYWSLIPTPLSISDIFAAGSYKLYNVKTKKYMYANNPDPKNNQCIVADKKSTMFNLYNNHNTLSIKLDQDMPNQNGTQGWHLYTAPKNNLIYGAGNNGPWATFQLELVKEKYYLIKSFHDDQNKMGNNERFLYVSDNNILTDGDRSMEECLWLLIG